MTKDLVNSNEYHKLSLDILTEFPNMSGFSTRNLKRTVRFYKEYKDEFEKVPLSVAQLENLNVQLLVAQIFHVFIKNIQGYVKKMAKFLHVWDVMLKKVRDEYFGLQREIYK